MYDDDAEDDDEGDYAPEDDAEGDSEINTCTLSPVSYTHLRAHETG